jgi:hypothetical protein
MSLAVMQMPLMVFAIHCLNAEFVRAKVILRHAQLGRIPPLVRGLVGVPTAA